MTGKEFMAAGLTKLSPEELDALNAWIRNRSLATLDKPVPGTSVAAASSTAETGDRRGLPSDDDRDDSPIRSAIIGEFDGWDGQTVFRLENGMIWVQDDRDKFYARDIENAIAVIEPGMFDSWHLHIEGYKAECKVRRIQ
jgi:Cu2+-containing amine oxidase